MDFNKLIKENLIVLRPSIPESYKLRLMDFITENKLEKSLFLASSGTTKSNSIKIFQIEHEMMLQHALMINKSFFINEQSVYLKALKSFYMGGISILYRQYQSGMKVVEMDNWDVHDFHRYSNENLVTHVSLVPTQVFDLVKLNIKAPSSLKVCFIGGDYLASDIKDQAIRLGYPIYHTYGASEFCSQVATSKALIGDSGIKILKEVSMKIKENVLFIKPRYHFSKQIFMFENKIESKNYKDFIDNDGFFQTKDLALIEDNYIKPLGRQGDLKKVNGVFVSLMNLESKLRKEIPSKTFYLKLKKNLRRGHEVILVGLLEDKLFWSELSLKEVNGLEFLVKFSYTDSGKLIKI